MTEAANIAVRRAWPAERAFYLGMTAAMAAALLLGFSRSFFLRPLFPEFAAAHAPAERYFYLVHAPIFTLWFVLLMVQPGLVAAGRVRLHRRLGWFGAVVAALVVVAGLLAGLIAARRPAGFIDVPVPPLQFLLHVVALLALFGGFVAMAVVTRRDPQSHKRWMLLASINLVEAAVVRWPFDAMAAELPAPGYMGKDLVLFLFLAAMIAWDLRSRRSIHRATLAGGMAIVLAPAVVALLWETRGWLAVAGWAVGLLGK